MVGLLLPNLLTQTPRTSVTYTSMWASVPTRKPTTMRNPFTSGASYNVSVYDPEVAHERITHTNVSYVGVLDSEYVFKSAPGTPGAWLMSVFPDEISHASSAWIRGKIGRSVVPVHRRECGKRGDPDTMGYGHVCNTERAA